MNIQKLSCFYAPSFDRAVSDEYGHHDFLINPNLIPEVLAFPGLMHAVLFSELACISFCQVAGPQQMAKYLDYKDPAHQRLQRIYPSTHRVEAHYFGSRYEPAGRVGFADYGIVLKIEFFTKSAGEAFASLRFDCHGREVSDHYWESSTATSV